MDLELVEKIVHEVKSQGVFDEFRKDLIADVDTKPAYQNLRQRVDSTVKQFLSTTKWTPETNKNQLREKMRRHIAESGFLDTGVERIVHQVVNPKMNSVFQNRIEEIAYKFLGLPVPPKHAPPPHPPLLPALPPLPTIPGTVLEVETLNLLPTDLEQVSPDSTASTSKSEDKGEPMDDDEESPPFEPLNMPDNMDMLTTEQNMDLSNTPSPPPMPEEDYKPPLPPPPCTPPPPPGVIEPPPLPPGESEPQPPPPAVNEPPLPPTPEELPPLPPIDTEPPPLPPVADEPPPLPPVEYEHLPLPTIENGSPPPLPIEEHDPPPLPPGVDALPPLPPTSPPPPLPPPPATPPPPQSPTAKHESLDCLDGNTPSEPLETTTSLEKPLLEQVENFSESASVKCETKTLDIMATINSNDSQLSQVSSDSHLSIDFNERKSHSPSEAAVNISEEAQMPKFNENSSEYSTAIENQSTIKELHFDIKKDEIKFEGTERKNSLNEDAVDYNQQPQEETNTAEVAENTILVADLPPQTQTQTLDSNFYSSLNDSSSAQLCIVEPDDQSVSSEESRPVSSLPLVPQATSSPSPPPSAKSPIDNNSNTETTASQEPQCLPSKPTKSVKSKKHSRDKDREKERQSSSSRSQKSSGHSHRNQSDDKNNKESDKATKRRSSSSSKSGSKHRSTSHKSSRKSHSSSHKSEKSETKTDTKTDDKTEPKLTDDHYSVKERNVRRKSPDSNDDEGEGANGNTKPAKSSSTCENGQTHTEEAAPKTNENSQQMRVAQTKEVENNQTETVIECDDLIENKIMPTDSENDSKSTLNTKEIENPEVSKLLTENIIKSKLEIETETETPDEIESSKDNMEEEIEKDASIVVPVTKEIPEEVFEELTYVKKEDYNEEIFTARMMAYEMFIGCIHDISEAFSKSTENKDKKEEDIERNNNNTTNERKRPLSYSLSEEENTQLQQCSCEPTNVEEECESTGPPNEKRQKIEGEFAMSLSKITDIDNDVEQSSLKDNSEGLKRTKQNSKQRYTCEDLYKPRTSTRTSRRRSSPIL